MDISTEVTLKLQIELSHDTIPGYIATVVSHYTTGVLARFFKLFGNIMLQNNLFRHCEDVSLPRRLLISLIKS